MSDLAGEAVEIFVEYEPTERRQPVVRGLVRSTTAKSNGDLIVWLQICETEQHRQYRLRDIVPFVIEHHGFRIRVLSADESTKLRSNAAAW